MPSPARQPNMPPRWRPATSLLLPLLLAGCSSLTPGPHPLDDEDPAGSLRSSVFNYHMGMLTNTRPARVGSNPPPGDVEAFLAKEGNLEEADKSSGLTSYGSTEPDPGKDLLGHTDKIVQTITLRGAVVGAMQTGLDPRIARISPRIADAKTEQARGAFDPTVYADTGVQKTDTLSPLAGQNADTTTETGKVGIKQKFLSGTLVDVSGDLTRGSQKSPSSLVNPWWQSDLALQVTQPLLRGAGLAVNRSEMDLARNAAKVEREKLREALLKTAGDTAEAYWKLADARDETLVQERLVQRTRALAEHLRPRLGHDVLGADMAEVMTRLSTHEGDLDTARSNLRNASDSVKRLLDDPRLPLSGECVLLPQDRPEIKDIQLDLAQAMRTALICRPDLAEAMLGITDSDVRLLVARNAQLPVTDLKAGVTLHSLESTAGQAISSAADGRGTDAAISLHFEQALGMRSATAQVAQQREAHRQTILIYQRTAREALLEVKTAMRKVILAHSQISRTRATRRSAAEALRVAEHRLEENPAGGDSYTTMIDRILDRQDTLGRAEISEAQTRYDFMIALARLDQAMGVLIDRFGVQSEDHLPVAMAETAADDARTAQAVKDEALKSTAPSPTGTPVVTAPAHAKPAPAAPQPDPKELPETVVVHD